MIPKHSNITLRNSYKHYIQFVVTDINWITEDIKHVLLNTEIF